VRYPCPATATASARDRTIGRQRMETRATVQRPGKAPSFAANCAIAAILAIVFSLCGRPAVAQFDAGTIAGAVTDPFHTRRLLSPTPAPASTPTRRRTAAVTSSSRLCRSATMWCQPRPPASATHLRSRWS
jgi:hypothetical protein